MPNSHSGASVFYYMSKPRGRGKIQPPYSSSLPPLCSAAEWMAWKTRLPLGRSWAWACPRHSCPGEGGNCGCAISRVPGHLCPRCSTRCRGGASQLLPECPGQRAWGTHMSGALKPLQVPKHRWEGTRQHPIFRLCPAQPPSRIS